MKFLKTRPVKSPTRGTPGSAGIDFYIPDNFARYFLIPGKSLNVPSGLRVNVPEGHALIMMNKSGIATKKSLLVGACVVDEDYQGEIHLHVINVGDEPQMIEPGQKLVQGLLIPVTYMDPVEVFIPDDLYGEISERGSGGFGSTGL